MIFLVSQPRAGSTMTQLVLSNAGKIKTGSEAWLQFALLGLEGNVNSPKAYKNLEMCLAALNETYQSKAKEELHCLWNKISEAVYGVDDEGDDYFLDKTPRYYLLLEKLKEVYPCAKIIILKRDPEDVLSSIITTWHSGRNVRRIARSHYQDLFVAPRALYDFGLKYKEHPNVYTVRYEDLVSNSSEEFQSLFRFIGIEFKEEYLDFSNNKKLQGGFGDPTGVKHNKSPSVKMPKATLPDKQASLVKYYLSDLGEEFLEQYGYVKQGLLQTTPKSFKRFKSYGERVSNCGSSKLEFLKARLSYYL